MYNKSMGGVDVCDQMMEAYRTFMKTRKLTLKFIIHMMDRACVNAGMEYTEACELTDTAKKDTLDIHFRMSLSGALLAPAK